MFVYKLLILFLIFCIFAKLTILMIKLMSNEIKETLL